MGYCALSQAETSTGESNFRFAQLLEDFAQTLAGFMHGLGPRAGMGWLRPSNPPCGSGRWPIAPPDPDCPARRASRGK